jgi:hypothetical protein
MRLGKRIGVSVAIASAVLLMVPLLAFRDNTYAGNMLQLPPWRITIEKKNSARGWLDSGYIQFKILISTGDLAQILTDPRLKSVSDARMRGFYAGVLEDYKYDLNYDEYEIHQRSGRYLQVDSTTSPTIALYYFSPR